MGKLSKKESLEEITEEVTSAITEEQKELGIKTDYSDKDILSTANNNYVSEPLINQINYEELFSYLETKTKENPYTENHLETTMIIDPQLSEKNYDGHISYKEIEKMVINSKINQVMQGEQNTTDPDLKERFENFKKFNFAHNMLSYQLTF